MMERFPWTVRLGWDWLRGTYVPLLGESKRYGEQYKIKYTDTKRWSEDTSKGDGSVGPVD